VYLAGKKRRGGPGCLDHGLGFLRWTGLAARAGATAGSSSSVVGEGLIAPVRAGATAGLSGSAKGRYTTWARNGARREPEHHSQKTGTAEDSAWSHSAQGHSETSLSGASTAGQASSGTRAVDQFPVYG